MPRIRALSGRCTPSLVEAAERVVQQLPPGTVAEVRIEERPSEEARAFLFALRSDLPLVDVYTARMVGDDVAEVLEGLVGPTPDAPWATDDDLQPRGEFEPRSQRPDVVLSSSFNEEDWPGVVAHFGVLQLLFAAAGYSVKLLRGPDCTITAWAKMLKNSPRAVIHFGHGHETGFTLTDGHFWNTYFKGIDLSMTVFTADSCLVGSEPTRSAIVVGSNARAAALGKELQWGPPVENTLVCMWKRIVAQIPMGFAHFSCMQENYNKGSIFNIKYQKWAHITPEAGLQWSGETGPFGLPPTKPNFTITPTSSCKVRPGGGDVYDENWTIVGKVAGGATILASDTLKLGGYDVWIRWVLFEDTPRIMRLESFVSCSPLKPEPKPEPKPKPPPKPPKPPEPKPQPEPEPAPPAKASNTGLLVGLGVGLLALGTIGAILTFTRSK